MTDAPSSGPQATELPLRTACDREWVIVWVRSPSAAGRSGTATSWSPPVVPRRGLSESVLLVAAGRSTVSTVVGTTPS